ncbi:hypothetical protein GIB67_012925, partial [Kingdonia uniflora]
MGPLETWETKKCAFKDIDKASKNLKLFKADLLDYNSLHAAIEGCIGVFHVACPVPSEHIVCVELDTSMHLEEEACLETRVKRVVSVSSDGVVAESKALEYAKETKLDVVTVCPRLVIGPMLQSTTNASTLHHDFH